MSDFAGATGTGAGGGRGGSGAGAGAGGGGGRVTGGGASEEDVRDAADDFFEDELRYWRPQGSVNLPLPSKLPYTQGAILRAATIVPCISVRFAIVVTVMTVIMPSSMEIVCLCIGGWVISFSCSWTAGSWESTDRKAEDVIHPVAAPLYPFPVGAGSSQVPLFAGCYPHSPPEQPWAL